MAEFREILVKAYTRLDGTLVCSHLRTIKAIPKKSPKKIQTKKIIDPNQLSLDLEKPLNKNHMEKTNQEIKNCEKILKELHKLKKENTNNFEFGSKTRRYIDNLVIGKEFDWEYQPKW